MRCILAGLVALVAFHMVGAEIHDACRRGDLEAVKKIAAADTNAVNLLGQNKLTPLMLAARTNAVLTEFLLQHGANPNQRDALGGTAMHGAAVKHKPEVIHVLAKYGGDVNARNDAGNTPALIAADILGAGRKATLEALIQNKADLTVTDKQGGSMRTLAKMDPALATILKELKAKY